MTKQDVVLKFIENPSRMGYGAGKLAKQYQCTKQDIYKAREEARETLNNKERQKETFADIKDDLETLLEINDEKGTLRSVADCDFEPKSHDELYSLHKIDRDEYIITNYWSKLKSNGKFTSSVFCKLRKFDTKEEFQELFISFLKEFSPNFPKYEIKINNERSINDNDKIQLVLPKQDAHFNKYDINGNNNIENRFISIENATLNILKRSSATTVIKEVLYVIGSDQFNSEWTGLTTKGTPQVNILTYQEAFKLICNHEIRIIEMLQNYSETVKIIFVPGNHDEFVGWHLINWLESYFKHNQNVEFDSSTLNTKYFKFDNSALMFNHGDDMKPQNMAHKFPMGFREKWSECNNFYIFSGDKHHELSKDIYGIRFFQIPQLSIAKGKWDDKKGFEETPEMTGFVIREKYGMSDILKEPIVYGTLSI